MTYGYNACAPGQGGAGCSNGIPMLCADSMIGDFETLFFAQAVDVELIKHRTDKDVEENGDFFGTRTPRDTYRKRIKIVVSAENTHQYRRDTQGIVTNERTYRAMAKVDAPIEPTDMVKFITTPGNSCATIQPGQLFVIKNRVIPPFIGKQLWQEFTLQRADKE